MSFFVIVVSNLYRFLSGFIWGSIWGWGNGGISRLVRGMCVDITGFDGAGHTVETMDSTSKASALLSEAIP